MSLMSFSCAYSRIFSIYSGVRDNPWHKLASQTGWYHMDKYTKDVSPLATFSIYKEMQNSLLKLKLHEFPWHWHKPHSFTCLSLVVCELIWLQKFANLQSQEKELFFQLKDSHCVLNNTWKEITRTRQGVPQVGNYEMHESFRTLVSNIFIWTF